MLVNKCHLGRSILPLGENIPRDLKRSMHTCHWRHQVQKKCQVSPGIERDLYLRAHMVRKPKWCLRPGTLHTWEETATMRGSLESRISAAIIFIPLSNNSRIQKLKIFYFFFKEINFFCLIMKAQPISKEASQV